MGKFPGKPSKIVNRKRIKVSKCSSSRENESIKAAENIYYGLTVFNETFGNEEQVTTELKGFTLEETQQAVAETKQHLLEFESICKLHGLTVSRLESYNREVAEINLNTDTKYESSPPNRAIKRTRKQQCFDGGGDGKNIQTVRRDITTSKRNISGSLAGSSTSLKNNAAKKLLQRAKKSSTHPVVAAAVDNLQQDKGACGAIRKFVLPSRSAHSSRVIKPNKRLIEGDEVASEVSVVRSASAIQLKKPKLILSPLRNSKHSESFGFGDDGVSEYVVQKDERVDETPLQVFDNISGDFSNRTNSLSPHSSPDDSLIVEGKRRWKPSYKVQLKLRELNVFGAGTSRFPFRRNLGSSTDASESVNSTEETYSQSTSSHTTDDRSEGSNSVNDEKVNNSSQWPNGSKVILRKARLKLNTHTSSSNEGPFSVSMGCGVSLLPGTVECGVCGGVRFYRFVKQARKFGIFSCESCRKFISKMIKRQACAKGGNLSTLDCHKGGGMCMVPPIVRSQQWKAGRGTLMRCSYKARCPACWLKKCLRSFNIPEQLRSNLVAMLPPELRGGLPPSMPVPPEDPPLLSLPPCKTESDGLAKGWPAKTNADLFQRETMQEKPAVSARKKKLPVVPKVEKPRTKKQEDKDLGRNNRNKRVAQIRTTKILRKATKNLASTKVPGASAESPVKEHPKKRKRNTRVKTCKKKGVGSPAGLDNTRRQRLDLKGPRVKHVCRSASIVLGQPAATFPIEPPSVREKVPAKAKPDTVKVPVKSSCCMDCKDPDITSVKPQNTEKNVPSTAELPAAPGPAVESNAEPQVEPARPGSCGEDSSAIQEDPPIQQNVPTPAYRKLNKLPPLARTLPMSGKQPAPDLQNLVSIDFWESYDPEEVCNTGFGIIGSEPFHVRAICFLCGSGGHEPLIHCASCCEPYHQFCLEDGVRDVWRCNWICQRCTVCHSCGRGQGQLLSCQRCHKTYHSECLGAERANSRLHSPDRPWVCPSCLRCKSCGVTEVTVFVGNLPLCKGCFKLRQKGNYCPLCQRCYEDHDYDTKMMECGKCNCWVHAKCEGLSDEKYQVLSLLPESVEFVCRMCCVMPPAPWWIAVEEELKAGYLGVLKSLSKNRKACAMLKWSPKKQCSCRPVSIGKRLDFSDPPSSKESESDAAHSPQHDTQDTQPPEILPDTKPPEDVLIKDSVMIAKLCGNELVKDSVGTKKPVEHILSNFMLASASKTSEKILMKLEPKADLKKSGSISSLSTTSEISVPTLELTRIDDPCNSEILSTQCSRSGSVLKGSGSVSSESGSEAKADDPALKLWREKYKIKECSVRVQDCLPKPAVVKSLPPVKVEVPCPELLPESSFGMDGGKSPGGKIAQASLATPCSDSGISSTDEELKPCGLAEEATEHARVVVVVETTEAGYSSSNGEENPVSESEGAASESSLSNKGCTCLEQSVRAKPSLTLLSIKKKVNASEYSSLLQFHQEMENLISRAQCVDLQEMYHHTLQEVFPWFDPKYARVSSRPMHDDHFYLSSPCKLGLPDCEKPTLDDSRTLNDSSKLDDVDQTPKYLMSKDTDYYYCGFKVEDIRTCVLCKGVGDCSPTEEGRLLYCGQNEWAHTNCALWSAEVFEEIDGSLQNVQSAMSRGRQIRCPWCGKRGASVGCCARNCAETYHFPCARKACCTFMDDKNVFCPTHAPDAVGKVLHLDSEFDIRRPIYVELDRKKKKFSEVQKVKFMIGSLLVESLGEFVSGASDHPDIIIPIDFRCTRLFWSSVEPWRVVQYHVKTSYQAEKPKPALDLGKNLTVDHTQEQRVVELKLDEVSRWHQELEQVPGQKTEDEAPSSPSVEVCEVNNKPVDFQHTVQGIRHVCKKLQRKTEEDIVARQVLNHILDTVCNRDVDDSCLSDPQNATDILPPELKDAIFEDLPHDLLDGISMQDIFPKLMSYEDPAVLDIKSDVGFGTDSLKDGKEDLSEDVILSSDVDVISAVGRSQDALFKGKRSEQSVIELGSQADAWFQCTDSKEQVQNLVEDFFQSVCQKNGGRELKRSKSEITPQAMNKKVGGVTRSQQRSCSLTWSCKLDGSVGAQAKRRKAARAVPRGSGGEGASNLATIDASADRAHMLQELRLPDGGLVTLTRSSTPSLASASSESVRELKLRLEDDTVATQAEGRRKVSHPKEEGKENKCLLWHGRVQPRLLQLDGTVDSSSSASEGGASPRQIDDDDDFVSGPRRKLQQNIASNDQGEEEPVRCTRCHRTYRTRTSFERHLPTCSSDFILSTSESDSENTRSSEEESSKKQQRPAAEQSEEKVPTLNCVANTGNQCKVPNVPASVKSKAPPPILTTQVNPTRNTPTQPRPRAPAVNGRSRGRATSRANTQRYAVRNASTMVNQSAQYHQPHSVVHTQSSQTSNAPTVIVQQVPSQNVVPAFVEAFQQQTGQSLQYIATIDTHNNGYNKHPFLTSAPNSLMSGTFQLQASPDGFTGLQNSGIPVMATQPTVLGTIIQQPPPTTIQCGMVTAEQMVLGSTPGLEMYTDQNGGMFLASQPMFIGLETVVSNTIMSSSQFMSAAMPGVVAASSSFSATTTQVFQASKLEPLLDVPSGFVIVNPHGPLTETSGGITCTPPPPVPMSLPSTMHPQQQQPPIITQTPVSTVQSAPWRYTSEYNNVDNFVHTNNTDYEQFSPQMAPDVRPSNFHIENYNVRPPVTKTTVSSNAPSVVTNTVASQMCNQSPHCHLKVIKTNDVPNTTCLPVACDVPVKSLPPQEQHPLPRPLPKVDNTSETPQPKMIVHTSAVEIDRRPVTLPVVQSKNGTNSRPIKMVFQKQSQDGIYKISSQNQNVRLAAANKPITVQPVDLKCTKPKPRSITPVAAEKRKDDAGQYPPLVLQSNQSNVNVPQNGATRRLPPNGKVNPPATIKDSSPTITYEIRSQDGFSCTSSSITEVWQKVFEAVQEARIIHKMPPLPQNPFGSAQDGLQMLGLKHNALRYLVEQLPGVGRCMKYKPRFHKLQRPCPEDDVDALPSENTTGSARSEPFLMRAPYDLFSWLASRHRQPPKFIMPADSDSIVSNRRATSSNLPMAMRFRHLKETSKEAVGVYRSHIHGRGLFCLRDIEAGEMVIEYAGEVIRSTLTDKREKLYESKGIGCYMFRIDDQLVVDATMRGNAARFINHSCEPNCYSRVVDILGKKHILIFALRRIPQGEELTYDYKFPFEDVKIPCTCGSRRCRKYLN